MGPARAATPLKRSPSRVTQQRGRLCAALLLFALAGSGCRGRGAPTIKATWRIGLGAVAIAVDAQDGKLAVACRRSNDVWVLDAAAGGMLHRIDTLPRPRQVLFHPERDAFFVAEGVSSVAQVRLRDERVARRFRPLSKVGLMAWEPFSERLFCAHEGLPTLGVYRLRDMHHETSVDIGGELVGLHFDGHDAWLATRQADALVKLSLTDLSVKGSALAGPDPLGLALDLDADRAYIACHGRKGEAAPLALPTPVPSPSATAFVPEGEDADDSGIPAVDLSDAPDDDVQEASSAWDGGGLAVFRLSDIRALDYLELPGGPMAIQISPDGKSAALACEDGKLRIVDLARRKVRSTLDLGGRPGAMALHSDGRRLLVALYDKKALLVVDAGRGW